ncbi:MAG: purine-nucleoside phosphorylase [Rhodospirillaceae bacterium]|jgi:xanthosine phosphorylase|nr:purine-nucleoside phosphorylase [Rhodospirillaceae bacterium]MBT5040512.1 purine-nucleoside phosphorylase [Rhodospirillaceae bacterium]MBT5675640.1 purine-nucleoside phosphorylase [Rhodospirillaceae bacterium]MBT5778052.1 purine-nucleoside phosphorylase [Rhodospirillaceae bacterium]
MAHNPQAAAEVIREQAPGFQPRLALVLGTGLGALAETIEHPFIIDYGDLPGFPRAAVEGHAGRLMLGKLAGVEVACMLGRAHLYEGHPAADLALPIRALRLAGCDTLILTNAAGSLNPRFPPGSLMMLSDHINMTGVNPLMGANDERFGERFFDMSQAYDRELRRRLAVAATALGIILNEGVYMALLGPNFETPAEIRAFRTMGADAVGMSTVPECLVARHCGMRVAAISSLTNLAAGMTDEELSHEQSLAVGALAAKDLSRLLPEFLSGLSSDAA